MLVDDLFALPPNEVMVKVLLTLDLLPPCIEGTLGKLIGFRLQSLEDLPAIPRVLGRLEAGPV